MFLYKRFENEMSRKLKKDILAEIERQYQEEYHKNLKKQIEYVASIKLPDLLDFKQFSEELKYIKGKFHYTTEEWNELTEKWDKLQDDYKDFCNFFGLNLSLTSHANNGKAYLNNFRNNLDFAFDTIVIASKLSQ